MRHLVWRFPRKSPCLSIYKTTFHRTEYGRSWAPCIQQIPANGGGAHRVTEGIRERSYWRASGRLEVCHQSVGFGHRKLEDTAFEVEIGELTRGVARSQDVVGPACTRIKPCYGWLDQTTTRSTIHEISANVEPTTWRWAWSARCIICRRAVHLTRRKDPLPCRIRSE